MRYPPVSLQHALLAASALSGVAEAARKPANSVLLSTVQSLTLRQGLKTSNRRVPAIPQLECVGGSARGLYEVDVMRCKNMGADYDAQDIQWTCTASLPPEFKLGSADVVCEGYDSPDDPYVLKGSCGAEYRLILTELGEEKYGRRGGAKSRFGLGGDGVGSDSSDLFSFFFWALFIGVLGYILYGAFFNRRAPGTTGGRPQGPWGGGGGGGGGNDDDDPPPPYDYQPPRKPHHSSSTSHQEPQQQGWRPGFWTGALGGAAATYMANRATANRAEQPRTVNYAPSGSRGGGSWWDNGEGSSRGGARGGSSSSGGSARYESTGFGSTRRR